eukprot:752195-Hanusia_phi.AAC.1
MPNSEDGWWVYKYYQSHVAREAREWDRRQERMKNVMLNRGGSDIVCIQEACGSSFDQDFQFMAAAGYDAMLHNKFRFRTATFWRRDKFALVAAQHKDRVLVTRLRSSHEAAEGLKASDLCVVNCHLTGGPNPDKRLRQVRHERMWRARLTARTGA